MTDTTMTIRMESRPGVLARIASMFHRRGIDIVTLTVAPGVEDPRVATMVLRAAAPAPDVARLALAIENLIDVYEVRVAPAIGPCDTTAVPA